MSNNNRNTTNKASWDRFYHTGRWQKLRRYQLQKEPLCKFCLEFGRVTVATVVDHVAPHKGDWNAFCTGKLQSLCEECHNSGKKQIEAYGYRLDIGVNGWPLDPNHPANRGR